MKGLILLLLALPLFGRSQKIVEDKVDEFNHHRVKRTSWELMVYRMDGHFYMKLRLTKVDSQYYLEAKYECYRGCAMNEGDKMMLKMENDSIFTVVNPKTVLSCRGCGATGLLGAGADGIDVSFPVTEDDIAYLSAHLPTKVRIYLADGYVENDIGKGNGKALPKMAALMK